MFEADGSSAQQLSSPPAADASSHPTTLPPPALYSHECSSSPPPFPREEAGGVFTEGVEPAQAPVRPPLVRGKIRSCYEEAAVW